MTRFLLFSLCVAVCFVVTPSVADAQKRSVSQEGLIPGRLWVMFSQDAPLSVGPGKTGMSFFDEAAARYGVVSIEKAFPMMDKAAAKRTLSESAEKLRYIYDVRYSSSHHPDEVAAALARDPSVIYAEARPYHYLEEGALLVDPDDPMFPSQEHLDHVGLPEAWDTVKGEEGDVVIAIVDGGSNWRHEDLEANVWNNPGEVPGNSIDDDGNGYVDDIHGYNFSNRSADPTGLPESPVNTAHGTAVAGVAAAVSNNGLGIAGASWNAKFMVLNAGCQDTDGALCTQNLAMTYAFMAGADIINASFGTSVYSVTEEMVVQAALEMGSLVVSSTGNNGINLDEDPRYPASYPATLSVGGTEKSQDRNVYNYGRSVNVFAPGIDVDVTQPDDRYGTRGGTSFATPLVSGIAALVKTHNPDFTPQQVREQVRITADNIDAANPEPPGSYGRGRVNALRAVTETSSPAVRMVEWDWTDEDRDGYWGRGEMITITAVFTNFLADAQGLTLQLESNPGQVSVMTDPISLGTLGSGQSHEVEFEILLLSSAPLHTTVSLYSHVTADSYDETPDVIRIPAARAVATHATSALEVTITGEGNIGYPNIEATLTPGPGEIGFRVNDANGIRRNVLFEGGLMVGTGVDRVSDCVHGVLGLSQDEDFTLKGNTAIDFQKPGLLTTEYGRLTLVESSDLSLPIGIEIVQESYVDDRPGNAEFLILKYQVTNTTEVELSDLYVSIFLDWDVSPGAVDDARFDDERGVGYVLDAADAPTVVAGTRLLTDNDKLTYRAIDNRPEIFGNEGFTPQEKWSFMSNGIQTRELTERDVSQMTGAGPYAILPGESISVAFALVAGSSTANFLRNADQAKVLWDMVLGPVQTATEDNLEVVTEPFAFSPIYPNPAEAEATLAFRVASASDVRLAVYDVLGRRVRMVWEGHKSSGAHTALWDGRDDAGQRAAPGVYMVRFTATGEGTNFRQSRPLILVR